MNTEFNKITTIGLMIVVVFAMAGWHKIAECKSPYSSKNIRIIKQNGARVDWSHVLNLIAFDKEGKDGYFDLYLMKPDGSNTKCLTCNKAGLPNRHMGQPAWHPSGEYIVFQAEEPLYNGHRVFSSPGWGIGNNLWIITKDGTKYWKITHVSHERGVVHPHFSPDGQKLVWSEIVSGECGGAEQKRQKLKGWDSARFWADRDWVLKLADFVWRNGVPVLENITQYKPGKAVTGLRESHSFSPDGEKVLFSSWHDHGKWWAPDIYSLELSTGKTQRLTFSGRYWDEHAHYSPDGKKIVWITQKWVKEKRGDIGNELSIMNADGTGKKRLTYFNVPGSNGYTGYQTICGDSSWGPDGKRIVFFRILAGKKNPESITFPKRTTEIILLELEN